MYLLGVFVCLLPDVFRVESVIQRRRGGFIRRPGVKQVYDMAHVNTDDLQHYRH